MLVTVTNTSGITLNTLALAEDGVATGGSRENPLPYPFGHIGELLDTIAKVLPMHTADLREGAGGATAQMGRGLPARDRWNQLVQAGTVTFAAAAQTDATDVEDVSFGTI